MSPVVEARSVGSVGVVTLNRPEKRNAINIEMRTVLREVLATLDGDTAVRAAVLTGAAPAFCAGVDLTEAASSNGGQAHPLAVPSVSSDVAAFGKPIIAAVNDAAAGGGFELALACDFIIASSTARFILPEARLGSVPGAGGTQRLVRALPRGLAARMLYTGEALDADDAARYGLATEVFAPAALLDGAIEVAQTIADNAPLSLAAVKRCLAAAENAPLEVGLELERTLWAALSTTADRAEGRAAFRERRPPSFDGH